MLKRISDSMTRCSSIIVLTLWCCTLCAAGLAHAREPESWTCTIDLHQGERGSLQITRTATGITGELKLSGSSAIATPVKGSWPLDVVRFSRPLPDATEQPFIGIAIPVDDHVMKMAGRFAAGFDLIWSATCSKTNGSSGDAGGRAGLPGPSLTTRINPYKPTSRDQVRFIAQASHSSGVRDVTIYVNGQPARTCTTEACEFTGGPYPSGTIRWRVSATAGNGAVQDGVEREVPIAESTPGTGTGSCSISGAAIGPRADLAKATQLVLLGPDSSTQVRARQSFGSGTFSFTKLPPGRYILLADLKGDTTVRVVPARREIDCTGAAITGLNFEFR